MLFEKPEKMGTVFESYRAGYLVKGQTGGLNQVPRAVQSVAVQILLGGSLHSLLKDAVELGTVNADMPGNIGDFNVAHII